MITLSYPQSLSSLWIRTAVGCPDTVLTLDESILLSAAEGKKAVLKPVMGLCVSIIEGRCIPRCVGGGGVDVIRNHASLNNTTNHHQPNQHQYPTVTSFEEDQSEKDTSSVSKEKKSCKENGKGGC